MLSRAIDATGDALERHEELYHDDLLGAGEDFAGDAVEEVSIGAGVSPLLCC